MININHGYFKFFNDIIESGCWATLSSAARSLYPVLLKFSDSNFKPVWPGTDKLLLLTGFKSKKSLQAARKELHTAGLIDYVPGTGRTSTRYYFRFDYRGSLVSPRGALLEPSEGTKATPLEDTAAPPNNIQITITNNLKQKEQPVLSEILSLVKNFTATAGISQQQHEDYIKNYLIEKYGDLETGEAIRIAVRKGKNGDINYLEGILKNRSTDKPVALQQGKQRSTSNFLGSVLTGVFAEFVESLEERYKVGNKIYLQCLKPIDNNTKRQLEEEFQKNGVNAKILSKEDSPNLYLKKSG